MSAVESGGVQVALASWVGRGLVAAGVTGALVAVMLVPAEQSVAVPVVTAEQVLSWARENAAAPVEVTAGTDVQGLAVRAAGTDGSGGDAVPVVWGQGSVVPGAGGSVAGEVVLVDFSGHGLDSVVDVTIVALDDARVASAVGSGQAVVLAPGFDVSAVDGDGVQVTSFPNDTEGLAEPAGPAALSASARSARSGGVSTGPDGGPVAGGQPLGTTAHPEGADFDVDDTANSVAGDDGEDTVAGVHVEVDVDPAELEGVSTGSVRLMTREMDTDPWQVVPSYLDVERSVVVGELDHLSQFVVIGVKDVGDPRPRVVLDPDNDRGYANGPGPYVTEVGYNVALANAVAARLTQTCNADVVVTRPTPIPDLDQTIRAGMAYAHGPDLTLTIGFNSTTGGNPWGNIGNGGSEVYARGGGLDEQARATMLGILPVYTTRPATAKTRTSPLLPYDDYQGLPGALVHLETLYLNHNFDRVVIDQGFSFIVDGVFTSLGVALTNQGFNCVDPNPGGGWPDPPSSAQVAAWMQLGFKNYAAYGGDPVNFATGNLVELEDLFHVTGPGGSSTQVALVYNSMDGRQSRFGTGWASDLTARAQRFTDGSVMVVRGDGASWVFAPNGSGGYTADANTGATLAEAGGGHLLLTVDDGTVWRFDASHPEGVGDVVERVDPAGAVTRFEYAALTGDPLFRSLTGVVTPGGQRVTVTSDSRGMVTALTAPDGRVWRLGYDGSLDLRTITGPDGRVRSFDYDGAHRMVTARDAAGTVYLTNVYDTAGRVVSQGDGVGGTRRFAYRAGGVDYTDAAGSVWSYQVDARSRVTSMTDPLGQVTAFEYGALDAPTAMTTPGQGRVEYDLDAKGRATSAEGAAGEVDLVRDGLGRVTRVTQPGPDGVGDLTTSFERDAAGRVTRVTGPDGAVEVTEHDAAGNPVRFVDAVGEAWTATFDARGNQTTATDPLGGTSTFGYDAGNRLVSATAPSGAATALAYDTAGRLTSETDPVGAVTRYGYDANDHLTTVTDPNGGVTRQDWDTGGRLVQVTDPTGAVTRYGYNAEDVLVSETDPTGAVTQYTLDAAHRVTAVTDPNGGTWARTLDAAGRVVAQTDPDGGVSTWEYDDAGNLIAETDPDGVSTGYAYALGGWLVEVRDTTGGSVSFTYDAAGRVVAENGPAGAVSYAYDAVGQLVATTDQAGNAVTSEYDAAGRLVAQSDRTGAETVFEYDEDGNQAATVDADGVRETYTLDPAGRVVAEGIEGGASWAYTYDAAGQVLTVTDAAGAETGYAYDGAGRRVEVTDPTGAVTGFGYDAAGRQTSSTDAAGVVTAYGYDPAGQLVSVTQNATGTGQAGVAENVTTAYEYTPTGRLARVISPIGGVSEYGYTPGGRVVSESDPLGNTWSYAYDDAGRLAGESDPDGRTVGYTYDDAGRITTIVYGQGRARVTTATVGLEYDVLGNAIAMTDSTGVTGWTYDAEGRQTAQRTLAGTLTTAYTAAGRRAEQVTPDGTATTWVYDDAGRVTEQGTAAGVMSYEYDPVDRVVQIVRTNTDGTAGPLSAYAYDGAGRTTAVRHQVTEVQPAPVLTLGEVATDAQICLPGVEYLAGRTLPGAGTTGSGVWDIAIGQTYTPAGHVATRTRADAGGQTLAGEYAYDPLGRLTGATETDQLPEADDEGDGTGADDEQSGTGTDETTTTGGPGTIGTLPDAGVEAPAPTVGYTYDASGNRTSVTTSLPDGSVEVQQGRYDAANRLTRTTQGVLPADQVAELSLATGALGAVVEGTQTSYAYDGSGNRLTQSTRTARGNVLSGEATVREYTYGAEGRLASVSDADRSVEYTRDGLGRTVATTTATEFVTHTATATWDGFTQVATTDDTFGTTSYARDVTGAVAVQSSTRIATNAEPGGVGSGGSAVLPGSVATGATWELTDALGSVIAQASGDTITQTAWYDPWGEQDITTTAGWDSDHGYTSQITDTGLGEVLFYARTYDPVTGTFTSLDPWDGLLTEPGTLNPYAYVLNDPLTTVDVLGHWPGWLDNINWREVAGTVAGVAAGIAVGVAVGACVAATAGICGGVVAGVGVAVTGGAAAGAAGAAVNYAVTGNNGHYSWSGGASAVGQGALFGAAAGGLGYGVSRGLQAAAGRISATHRLVTDASSVGSVRGAWTRVGSRSANGPDFPSTNNFPMIINNRQYTGHAIDRMQTRGIPPSVVEDTIRNGQRVWNGFRKVTHVSAVNGVSVVRSRTGRVITVMYTRGVQKAV